MVGITKKQPLNRSKAPKRRNAQESETHSRRSKNGRSEMRWSHGGSCTRPGTVDSVGSVGSACSSRGICDFTVLSFLWLPAPSSEKQQPMAAACGLARRGNRGIIRKPLAERYDTARSRKTRFVIRRVVLPPALYSDLHKTKYHVSDACANI